MSLDANAVRRIAHLARIEVSDDEVTQVRDQLNDIFAMIEQMQSVDTAGIEPMAHAQDVTVRLREDVVTEPDQRGVFQAAAPQTEQGLYLVPKVIE